MVAVARRCAPLAAAPLGILLLASSGCSSFDSVKETRFTPLQAGNNIELGIQGAHWVAYDDQHSLTSGCTNGAAGNHAPEQCSLLYEPAFKKEDDPKCPKGPDGAKQRDIVAPDGNAPICIQGVLRPLLPCGNPPEQCSTKNSSNDLSNMWGAGVGLALSPDGKQPWNASEHGVRGVAFDLSGMDPNKLGEDALNVRVELPIVLDPNLELDQEQPLMRSDGSVIGTDRKLYRYDCDSKKTVSDTGFEHPKEDEGKLRMRDALADADTSQVVTSELHPSGSPFWQPERTSAWVPSPIKVGHNEFEWQEVLAPKSSIKYEFDRTQILGVHFQVVHAEQSNTEDLPFAFCVSNLAFLLEE